MEYVTTGAILIIVLVVLSVALPLLRVPIEKLIIARANELDKDLFVPLPQTGKFSFEVVQGRLVQILENVSGWYLERCSDGVVRFRKQRVAKVVNQGFWGLGVIWVGFNHRLKKFVDWKWTEFRQQTSDSDDPLPKFDIIARKKHVYEFFHQFDYAIELRDLELADNTIVHLKVLITTFLLDPTQAFFNTSHYDDSFVGRVYAAIKGWVTVQNFEGLKASTKETTHESPLAIMLRELNGIQLAADGDPNYATVQQGGLLQTLGIVVWNGVCNDISTDLELAKALQGKELARLAGEKKIEDARQEQEEKRIKTETEVRTLEALRNARRDFIQQTVVQPIIDAGGNAALVAKVLEAQQWTSPDSKVTTLAGGLVVDPRK